MRKIFYFKYFSMVFIGLVTLSLITPGTLKVNANLDEITRLSDHNLYLRQGEELFLKARKMFYNAEATSDEVQMTLDHSKELFSKAADGYDKYFYKAKVALLSGEMAEVAGDKQKADEDLNESNELISKALDFNPKSSEANRIFADTIMRLMSYKGTIYRMTKGPQALNLLNKALSLDEKNYAAMNSLGMYYINAPAIGGGSFDKGIEILHKALESKDPFDNFITYVWLGNAFRKKKNSNEAMEYYQKALRIYPNSPWVKRLLQTS